MAYVTEADAGFRITGFTHGATTILGRLRAFVQKLIDREVIQADGNNVPIIRPPDTIDARAVLAFLDMPGHISHSAAAANLVIDMTQADAGAASLTVGKMVASGVDNTMQRRMGGFAAEQVFELEGALTYTPSF